MAAGVASGRIEEDHPPAVGSTFTATTRIGGTEQTSTLEITEISSPGDRPFAVSTACGKVVRPGGVSFPGTPIDLSKVACGNVTVAGLRDHVTTWRPCYVTSQLPGGDSEVVVVNSGHVQPFVNPVGESRYRNWSGPAGGPDPGAWLAQAELHEGSWWPRWAAAAAVRTAEAIPRRVGKRAPSAGEPAPGRTSTRSRGSPCATGDASAAPC